MKSTWEALDRVEGWFSYPSFCLWNALLEAQAEAPGHLVEIGVWRGRSAAVLARHRRAEEQLVLCDPSLKYLDDPPPGRTAVLPGLKAVGIGMDGVVVVATRSEHLLRHPIAAEMRRSVRWLHIDGEHTGRAVFGDLEIAHELLAAGGLVVIDDFFSPMYPQITAATYAYLTRHPYDFRLLLVGFDKAYLCRPASYVRYQTFVARKLGAMMHAAGSPVTLFKTSGPEDETSVSGPTTSRLVPFAGRTGGTEPSMSSA